MNQETMTELVILAQAGDTDALEQLLFYIHTPVAHLCRKLLRSEEAAEEEIREILSIAAGKLNTLQDPELFEKWILRITASRCMQMLPQLRWGSQMDEELEAEPDIPARELTPEQTVDAIQTLVDSLPEDPRICILLYCCTGMHSRSIAQITGFSQDAIRANLAKSQELLQQKLEACQQEGTVFTGITSLAEILRAAMYHGEDREAALPLVYGVLGKEIPLPPDPTRWIVRLLTVIFVLLLIVFLGLSGLLIFRVLGSRLEEPVPTTIATEAPTTMPTEVTTLPTETTVPETTEATEAPTVPETTQAEETEPTEETMQPTEASKPTTTSGQTSSNTGNSSNSGGSKPPADAPQTGEDGHTHRYLTTRTNFNCETGGTRRYLCADCDYYYTVELSPSGSHSFIVVPAGPMGSSPTCTKAGTALKACTNCNYSFMTEDPSQPALGHSYTDTVVAPAPGVQGYTQHTCSRCGDSYTDTYVDALPTDPPADNPPVDTPPANDPPADDSGEQET